MPPDGDLSKRESHLKRLRDEMEQAKALYEGAKEAYEQAKRDLEKGRTPPDAKVNRAFETKDALLCLYVESVKRYNGYLLENLGSEPRVHRAAS